MEPYRWRSSQANQCMQERLDKADERVARSSLDMPRTKHEDREIRWDCDGNAPAEIF